MGKFKIINEQIILYTKRKKGKENVWMYFYARSINMWAKDFLFRYACGLVHV